MTVYIGAQSKNPRAWPAESYPPWTNASVTPLDPITDGFQPVRFTTGNGTSAALYHPGFTEPVAQGDVITFKARLAPGATPGGVRINFRTSNGTVSGQASTSDLSLGLGGWGSTGAVTVVSSTPAGNGAHDVVFRTTVVDPTMKIGISTATDVDGKQVDVWGLQVVRGASDAPWTAVTTTTVDSSAPGPTPGSPQDHYYVDPHDPMFAGGAKGDAVSATGYVENNNQLRSPSYSFTAADIDKTLWLGQDDTPRQITGVGGPQGVSAIFSPPANNGVVGNDLPGDDPGKVWDQPELFLLGSDDTAALQAALDYAATAFAGKVGSGLGSQLPATYVRGGIAMGGVVKLRGGHGYIVGNSKAAWDGGKTSALTIWRRTSLVGGGASFFGSALYLKPGSWGDVIANEGSDAPGGAFSDFITISDLSIYCFASFWNGAPRSGYARHGVKLRVAADGYAKTDPFNRLARIQVWNAGEAGFHLSGRGELYGHDLLSGLCQQEGFLILGLADSRFHHLVAHGNQWTGVKIVGGGPLHFQECKSYYSGASGGQDLGKCANWWVTTDNEYTGAASFLSCEAQESRGSAWVIESGRAQFVSCMAFDPGRRGLADQPWDDAGNPVATPNNPPVIAGFHLRGPFCNNNVFSACVVRPTLTNFSESAGHNFGAGQNGVHIDGFDPSAGGPQLNAGEIWTTREAPLPNRVLRGTEFRSGFGAKGGAGTSNQKNTELRVDGVACT